MHLTNIEHASFINEKCPSDSFPPIYLQKKAIDLLSLCFNFQVNLEKLQPFTYDRLDLGYVSIQSNRYSTKTSLRRIKWS